LGVVLGSAIPALAAIWQSRQAGQQARWAREAVNAERRTDHRLALVASWRAGLADVIAQNSNERVNAEENPLYRQVWYLSLRPHLTEEAMRGVEPGPRTLIADPGVPILFSLADEIARIEREWDLA
jgi:hypothetical protein